MVSVITDTQRNSLLFAAASLAHSLSTHTFDLFNSRYLKMFCCEDNEPSKGSSLFCLSIFLLEVCLAS